MDRTTIDVELSTEISVLKYPDPKKGDKTRPHIYEKVVIRTMEIGSGVEARQRLKGKDISNKFQCLDLIKGRPEGVITFRGHCGNLFFVSRFKEQAPHTMKIVTLE